MTTKTDFGAQASFELADGSQGTYYRLAALQEAGHTDLDKLPFSIRVLLEAALRNHDGFLVRDEDVLAIAGWTPDGERNEIPFQPSRVILQDFTGVPAVVDIAALRNAMADLGGDPEKVNPQVPVDLVIDHSVQVDVSGRHADARERAVLAPDVHLEVEEHAAREEPRAQPRVEQPQERLEAALPADEDEHAPLAHPRPRARGLWRHRRHGLLAAVGLDADCLQAARRRRELAEARDGREQSYR